MSIQIKCPECGEQFRRPDSLAGKLERCPNCRTVIRLSVDEPPASQHASTGRDRSLRTPTIESRPTIEQQQETSGGGIAHVALPGQERSETPSDAAPGPPEWLVDAPFWLRVILPIDLLVTFLGFPKAAESFAAADEKVMTRGGHDAELHRCFRKKFLIAASVFGALGLALGLLAQFVALGLSLPNGLKTGGDLLLCLMLMVGMPLFGVVLGACLGTALVCLFAPSDFLEGRAGRKWMRLIGTRTSGGARLVCFLLAMICAFFATLTVIFVITHIPVRR